MGIIVVHIDSQEDTKTLVPAYEGLEDAIILYNPEREQVVAALKEHPDYTAMFLGHGGPRGMFSKSWRGYVIDQQMVKDGLFANREVIGIWCHASTFGLEQQLRGFFTSMFISNKGEASAFGYKATDEECFEQNRLFATWVNELIKNGTPLKEWPDILRGKADMSIGFVNYNYKPLTYYDGTQVPTYAYDNDEWGDWYFRRGKYSSHALIGNTEKTDADEIIIEPTIFNDDENMSDEVFIHDCADDFLSLIYPDYLEREKIINAIMTEVMEEIYETSDNTYSSEDVEIAVRKVMLRKITR